VIPGWPHHITQRGNNRQEVFFADRDRDFYLSILREQARKNGLSLLGYCLMKNHVHLIAIPAKFDSLNKAVGRTHWIYAQYVNRRHGRSGHLWQGRFYSCPLDEAHLLVTMAYLERNPVRAKLVKHAWEYQWSSARAHLGKGTEIELIDLEKWEELASGIDWKNFLIRPEDKQQTSQLRLHTNRGRPLASDKFLSRMENALGRHLRPLPVGRPKEKLRA